VVKASKRSSTSNRAFYLIIAVIAVVGIAGLSWASMKPKAIENASPIDSTLPPVQSSGYTIGNPNAPVEVTEFGDFECPACGRFAVVTEPDVRKNYVNTGKVLWRFIDFPLNGHQNTWPASRAAACADEQGKFWEFHDALYNTQDQWNGEATNNPDKVMKQIGKQLGLDASKFDDCVDNKKTQAKVQAHWQLAMNRHVEQTPTFVVGDRQFAGIASYDDFAKILDSALAKAPAKAATATPSAPAGDSAKRAPLTPTKKSK
jgi:protein-disulfide isomerase